MKKKTWLIILFLMIFVSHKGYCAQGVVEKEEEQGSTMTEVENIGVPSPINFPKITQVLKSTGIVIVIIVVTIYFLRKKLGMKTGINKRKRYVHIIDSTSIGSKKYIHLVKIPGKVLLLGATSEQIQLLSEITEKEIIESIDREPQKPEFMSFFKRACTEYK